MRTLLLATLMLISTQPIALEKQSNHKQHHSIERKKHVKKPKHLRQRVLASFYGYESGKITASGKPFNPLKMTAAHKTLPFGTRLKVTNLENKKTVTVVINDRGPYIKGRSIDLSLGAARRIGMVKMGVTKVLIESI